VRNNHAFKSGIVKVSGVRAFDGNMTVPLISIDGKNKPAPGEGGIRSGWISEGAEGEGSAGKESTGRLQEISSVHGA
jgi:hypothetical protein